MKQLLPDISNRQLAAFTTILSSLLQAKKQAGKDQKFSFAELSDHAGKLATFSEDDRTLNFSDLKISDANRDAVLRDAEQNAAAYADARNKRTTPKSFSYASRTESIVSDVKDWLERRKLRGHG